MLETLNRRLQQEWDRVGLGPGQPTNVHYLCVSGSVEGGTTTLLAFVEGWRRPSFVVKVQRDPEEREAAERERAVLDELWSRGDFFRASIPRVLLCERIGGFWVLAQSIVDGSPLAARLSAEGVPDLESARGHVELVVDWLIECHRGGAVVRGSRSPDWVELALQPIVEFEKAFEVSPGERAHLGGLREAIERLREGRVPLTIRHGDFCRHNILLSRRHGAPRVGVIDWTFSQPIGLPLHDLVFFLGTYCLQIRRERGVAGLERVFADTFLERNAWSRLVSECLARYCQALDIDRELAPALFAICLIEQALFEYRQVANALRRGRVPRFAMFLAAGAACEYEEAPKAQLWRRFFRLFVNEPSALVA